VARFLGIGCAFIAFGGFCLLGLSITTFTTMLSPATDAAESFLADVHNDDYTSALARMSSAYQAGHSATDLQTRVEQIPSLADHRFAFLTTHEDHEDDRVTVEGSVYGPDGEAPIAFEVSQVNGYWYVDLVAVEGQPLE
jgi:hypothetical protein